MVLQHRIYSFIYYYVISIKPNFKVKVVLWNKIALYNHHVIEEFSIQYLRLFGMQTSY